MGATAAIGTGLSIITGLNQASEKNKQAAAQKKAIENQQQVDALNSQLQLMSLRNSRAANEVQNLLQSTAEQQAYLSRQAQLNVAETQNQLALGQAAVEAQTQGKLGEIQQQSTSNQALAQSVEAQGNIANALTQAIGASSQEQQEVLKSLQALPERQRADAIANLLNAVSSNGGTNVALTMLTEVVDNAGAGRVARATEAGAQKTDLARANAQSQLQQVEATRRSLEGQAGLQGTDAAYQSRTAALDVQTAGQVAKSSFETQRTATEAAYRAGQLSRGVSTAAASAAFNANEEVLQRGAKLSAETAAIQSSQVRGAGFVDFLNIAGTGYNTYTNLGGSFLAPKKAASSRALTTDVTNYNSNAA